MPPGKATRALRTLGWIAGLTPGAACPVSTAQGARFPAARGRAPADSTCEPRHANDLSTESLPHHRLMPSLLHGSQDSTCPLTAQRGALPTNANRVFLPLGLRLLSCSFPSVLRLTAPLPHSLPHALFDAPPGPPSACLSCIL